MDRIAGRLTTRLTGHAERGQREGDMERPACRDRWTDGQTDRQMVPQFEAKKREKSGFYRPDKQTSGRTYRLTDILQGCAKTGRRGDPNTLDIPMWKLGCDALSRWRKDVASLKTLNMKKDSTLKCVWKYV